MPQLVEVRAALNRETNEPKYGDCTLSVGDGSVKVEFKRGRAVVDLEVAKRYLVENGDLEIPALGIYRAALPVGDAAVATSPEDLLREPQTQESVTAEGVGQAFADMTPEQRKAAAAELAELLAQDAEGSEPPEEEDEQPPPPEEEEDEQPPPEETEQEKRIREAQEHLAAEGEDVPEPDAPTRVVPDGFDDKTAEGDARCLAKKADGEQCKNAAKDDGPACQMPAHQEQFADQS